MVVRSATRWISDERDTVECGESDSKVTGYKYSNKSLLP